MTQYLIIFAVLFVPLVVVIILIQRMQRNTKGRLCVALKSKGWNEAANTHFICPPFLKDYKSIVHNELHKDNAVVQIVEHRMPLKIYLDTISFSSKLTSPNSSHVFLLDKQMGPPRSIEGLSVTNVASPKVSDKYIVYTDNSASEPLLNKIATLIEPICDDLPYTCIELKGSELYVTVVTHAITAEKVGMVADHFSDISKSLMS